MNLRGLIIRGLVVAFAIMFVYSAWVYGGGVYMLCISAVLFVGGAIYNFPNRQPDWTPFVIAWAFIIGALAAESHEIKTAIHWISVVVLAAVVLEIVFWIRTWRRRRQTEAQQERHFRELRQRRPSNWA